MKKAPKKLPKKELLGLVRTNHARIMYATPILHFVFPISVHTNQVGEAISLPFFQKAEKLPKNLHKDEKTGKKYNRTQVFRCMPIASQSREKGEYHVRKI